MCAVFFIIIMMFSDLRVKVEGRGSPWLLISPSLQLSLSPGEDVSVSNHYDGGPTLCRPIWILHRGSDAAGGGHHGNTRQPFLHHRLQQQGLTGSLKIRDEAQSSQAPLYVYKSLYMLWTMDLISDLRRPVFLGRRNWTLSTDWCWVWPTLTLSTSPARSSCSPCPSCTRPAPPPSSSPTPSPSSSLSLMSG